MFPKKMFEKFKLDHLFKKAGPGHKLTKEQRQQQQQSNNAGSSWRPQFASSSSAGPSKTESEYAQKAADAAIARYNQNKPGECRPTMRTHMQSEIEASARAQQQANESNRSPSPNKESEPSNSPFLLFKCPDIGPAVLPKHEMNEYIREFLYNLLSEHPGMASTLMIQTLNKNKENVKTCVDILTKYIDNLLKNPGEEKFRKIRTNNKAFKERVSPLEGSEEFLQSCGFERKSLQFDDQPEEMFLVIPEKKAENSEFLEQMKEYLHSAEAIQPQLDRALQVYFPSRTLPNFVVPQEFYNLTAAELKREQQQRSDVTEKLVVLRTKAMRERDEQRELRRYRYTMIRIRFPDSIILQGTFKAWEKFQALLQFVQENLQHEWLPFSLVTPTGLKLDNEATFSELGLAPTAVVNFTLDEDIANDLALQSGNISSTGPFLKPEVLNLIQEL